MSASQTWLPGGQGYQPLCSELGVAPGRAKARDEEPAWLRQEALALVCVADVAPTSTEKIEGSRPLPSTEDTSVNQ